jgi:UDP-N-acetylglucosamine 1-carboxyvinyltransferase
MISNNQNRLCCDDGWNPPFVVIAAVATGRTLIHDWVFENRAIYLTELNRLGGQVTLLDPHRTWVDGPTHWSAAEIICPALCIQEGR